MNWNELGNRFSMLRDDDAVGADTIKQRQALLLELGGRYALHEKNYIVNQKDCLVRKSGHFLNSVVKSSSVPGKHHGADLSGCEGYYKDIVGQ